MSVTIQPDGESEFLVKIRDVFLSYPHLFEPYRSRRPQLDENGKPKQGKYGAKFCFDKKNPENVKDARTIHAKVVEMAKKAFKQGLPADRYCIRDGAQLTDDMHGYYVLSASEEMKPTAVDRRLKPVTDEDDLFYAGCKVNATIRLWVQDNSDYGKRINANLVGVQFLEHGERWGGRAKPKVEDMFDDISDQFDEDEYAGGPTGDSLAHADGDDGFGEPDDGL